MRLYDWCKAEEKRLERRVTMAEVTAAGWSFRDVTAAPRLAMLRGVVNVLPLEIVAVEIRSTSTGRVPKGGYHAFSRPVTESTALIRLAKIMAKRPASGYTTHLLEEGHDA